MNKETKNLQKEIIRVSGVNPLKCMRCGKCSGTCLAYEEMEYHPHEFVYMVETGDIQPLLKSKSLYQCLSCFACVDRCPRGVEPAKIIEGRVRNYSKLYLRIPTFDEEILGKINMMLDSKGAEVIIYCEDSKKRFKAPKFANFTENSEKWQKLCEFLGEKNVKAVE